jgi:hypothetical protein
MTRTVLLTLFVAASGLAAAGCGSSDGPRNDMPVKTSNPVDKKTGKQQKIIEATLEDPGAKK